MIKQRLKIYTSFGGMIYGYNIGAMAGVLPIVHAALKLSHAQASFFVSSFLWGITAMLLITGYIVDTLGRKRTMQLAAGISLLSLGVYAIANQIAMLAFARFLSGVTAGMLIVAIPTYLTETLPSHMRGRGTVAFQLSLCFGIFLATILGFLFMKDQNWRAILLLNAIPTLPLCVLVFLIPESRSWLRNKVLVRAKITAAPPSESKNILKKLLQKKYRKSLLLVISIGALNQLTGINAFLQYDSTILMHAGFALHHTALLASSGVTLVNLLLTTLAILIVDRTERTVLLRFGLLGILICLLLGGCFSFFLPANHVTALLIFACLTGFIIFFALGPGALIWTILSEILPTDIRGTALSIALCVSSFSGAMLSALFLPLIQHIGLASVFIFCTFCTLLYYLITRYYPATRGLQLKEIEKIMTTSKN